MKKTLLFIAAAVAALVSCQNKQETVNENTVPEVKGVPMTLQASFSGATKTTFTPDGSGLKQTWDATESISVVTLSNSGTSGELVSVDTFTSTGVAGRTDATFSGTFTGGETPAFVMAVYPALEFDGVSSSYHTPAYNNGSNNLIWDAKIGSIFCNSDYHELTQTADNNLDHFTNFCLMIGTVDIDDIKLGTLTTTLSNMMSVIKIVATFPDSYKGKQLTSLDISCYDSADNTNDIFCSDSWEYLNIVDAQLLSPGSASRNSNSIYGTFNVPDTGVATIYMPCNFGSSVDFTAGDYWNLTATVNSVDLGPVKKTFTKDVSMTRGKMYTVNVTFTE